MNTDKLNNELWKQIKWGYSILALVCYYTFFQSFYNLIAYGVVIPEDTILGTLKSIFENFVPTCVTFFLNIFIVFRIFTSFPSNIKIILDAIASLLALSVLNFCYIAFKGLNFSLVNWAGTIFNDVFIFLGIEVYHYVLKFRASMIRERKTTALATNYKYEALVARLNPHFLFNSLSLLYLLIPSDTSKAQNFVITLSHMYRYVLSKLQSRRVELTEELAFIDTYEKAIMIGNDGAFKIRYTNRELAQGKWLIPCTLQLLVENVVRHNKMSEQTPMIADISISEEHIIVSNPKRPKPSGYSSKIGLDYITQMYGDLGKQVEILDEETMFSVKIPFVPSNTSTKI